MLDHAISRVWLKFYPTTLCREGEKTSQYCNFFLTFLPTAGIKPGPPAQQASALSITPLPLDLFGGYAQLLLRCLVVTTYDKDFEVEGSSAYIVLMAGLIYTYELL